MPEDCQQKENIIRIDRTLERVVAALEKVADQGARITHLEENVEHYFRDMENLYGRVRDTELTLAANSPAIRENQATQIEILSKKLDKVLNIVRIVTSKPFMYGFTAIILMIVSGTVLDVMYHFETLKKIWGVFHG